ncbi:MAG: phosphate transport system substrate-binding protein, partial [Hyphomicrobiales bacterium]|nr:phosphate transport system substrate-binding protein [Hyphomicrobiales bacterium]
MSVATRVLVAVPLAVMSLSSLQAADLSVVGTGDGIDLLRALGAAYTADHPDTNVVVPPSIGSGGGLAAVGSNKEVLARVARPLSDSEKEAGLVATPVFRLPSAFFVHRSAGVSSLTAAQLADIYSGKISNWRDAGGQDVRIKVVRR